MRCLQHRNKQVRSLSISTSSSEIHVHFVKSPPHACRGSPAFEHRDTTLSRQVTQYSRPVENRTWQKTRGQTPSSGMSLIAFLIAPICALTSTKRPLKPLYPVGNAAYLSSSTFWLPLPKSMMEGFDGDELIESEYLGLDYPNLTGLGDSEYTSPLRSFKSRSRRRSCQALSSCSCFNVAI